MFTMFSMSVSEIKELATNSRTFSKGHDYYCDGMVKKLKYSEEDNEITARVSGSELYDVSVTLDDEGYVDDMFCDCLAFDQYPGACKHIIAMLLEAHDRFTGQPAQNPTISANSRQSSRSTTQTRNAAPTHTAASASTAVPARNAASAPIPMRKIEDPLLKITREMFNSYMKYPSGSMRSETVNLRTSLVFKPNFHYPP